MVEYLADILANRKELIAAQSEVPYVVTMDFKNLTDKNVDRYMKNKSPYIILKYIVRFFNSAAFLLQIIK